MPSREPVNSVPFLKLVGGHLRQRLWRIGVQRGSALNYGTSTYKYQYVLDEGGQSSGIELMALGESDACRSATRALEKHMDLVLIGKIDYKDVENRNTAAPDIYFVEIDRGSQSLRKLKQGTEVVREISPWIYHTPMLKSVM